jgi:hypothetical protein
MHFNLALTLLAGLISFGQAANPGISSNEGMKMNNGMANEGMMSNGIANEGMMGNGMVNEGMQMPNGKPQMSQETMMNNGMSNGMANEGGQMPNGKPQMSQETMMNNGMKMGEDEMKAKDMALKNQTLQGFTIMPKINRSRTRVNATTNTTNNGGMENGRTNNGQTVTLNIGQLIIIGAIATLAL